MVGQEFGLVVLYGVLQPGGDGVGHEAGDARVCERGACKQPPLVPGVDGDRHEARVVGGAKGHEVRVQQVDALQRSHDRHHPQGEKCDGHPLVIKYMIE